MLGGVVVAELVNTTIDAAVKIKATHRSELEGAIVDSMASEKAWPHPQAAG